MQACFTFRLSLCNSIILNNCNFLQIHFVQHFHPWCSLDTSCWVHYSCWNYLPVFNKMFKQLSLFFLRPAVYEREASGGSSFRRRFLKADTSPADSTRTRWNWPWCSALLLCRSHLHGYCQHHPSWTIDPTHTCINFRATWETELKPTTLGTASDISSPDKGYCQYISVYLQQMDSDWYILSRLLLLFWAHNGTWTIYSL